MNISISGISFQAFLFSCMAAAFPSLASAQWTMSLPPPTQTSAYFANDNIGREVSEKIVRKERYSKGTNSDTETYERPKAIAPETFTFSPSMERRRATFSAMSEEFDKANPGRGKDLLAFLMGDGLSDLIQQVQAPLSQYGLSTSNLADAYTAYWITAWEAAHGVTNSNSEQAQINAVKKQVQEALATIPQIANAKDADQQAYAEVLLAQMVMIKGNADAAKSDASKQQKFAADVRATAKVLGVELDRLTLTADGFVPATKKRSDASDVVPSEEQALASADGSPGKEGLSTTNMALIAAAGGAGLAGVFLFGKAKGKKG
jgi:hypothetical protein